MRRRRIGENVRRKRGGEDKYTEKDDRDCVDG